MPAKPRDCPCHSKRRYSACCEPFHRGEREPESPEALMRSRYSAFALGLGDYLVRTLSADHPDRAIGEDALARELSHVKDRQRFLGLEILESSAAGDTGQVRFFARVFERGVNRSFEELSTFHREGGAWRYAGGSVSERGDKTATIH